MKKVFLMLVFLLSLTFVAAVPETNVSYFYSIGCTHCATVLDSGILDEVAVMEGVNFEKYETTTTQVARDKFLSFVDDFGIERAGVPFLVVERDGMYSYLMGDEPIINHAVDSIENFRGVSFDKNTDEPFIGSLSLGVVIVAALIDSINPCAFGVLLFLMAVMLSLGSNKRALRSGLIYTVVIFFVYLLAGLGIMKLINSFSILNYVSMVVGVVVLIGGIIELKDFFWEGKGISLKIPVGAKPLLEKYIRKGTLPAMFVLGALVALVELPCTGGIYLAILSLISNSGGEGIVYLLIYNFIFVLPLFLLTFMIYRGMKVEGINDWVQNNKKFMRLAAGLIMLFLAFTLLGVL